MKKLSVLILSVLLLTAFIVPLQAQTIGTNPYMRLIPLAFQVDTVRTANDSTTLFYIPCNMQLVRINVNAKTVTDTILAKASVFSATTNVTDAAIATATMLTANTVATGAPTARTTLASGTYLRIVLNVGTDAGNIAYKVRGIAWCLLQ